MVFARFDTRQIGPRLPATAGATAAPARQARPDLQTARLRNIPCLPPCGVQQSGRAFPHRGTADPTLGPGRGAEVRVSKHLPSNTESLGTSLRCGWCLRDLTRVKSGRACLPRQARKPRQPSRRAPIYKPPDCGEPLACRLAASSNRVGRSPTGGPLIRPSGRCRRVDAGKRFPSTPEAP